jgi:hypothetical protein
MGDFWLRRSCFILCVPALILLVPMPAFAVPAFARKYGVACSTCHEVWPKLNDFGQNFRDNGYRMNRERDNPTTLPGSYWPMAFRLTVGYQFQRTTEVPSDGGFSTTQTGNFGFTGLDILTAGSIGEQVSFLVVYTPGLNSSGFGLGGNDGGDLESAFAGFHRLFDTPYLNLRIGKHAPDLPIDEHRILTLTQGYAMYHFHPQGSQSTFEPGANQVGVELYGHSELDRFRYSVSFLNENDAPLFSKSLVSNPVVWGHVTGNVYLDSDVLAAIKGGVFGAIGFHPTTFDTVTTGTGDAATTTSLTGTGRDLKPFSRAGAELHLSFLSTVFPLTVSGVVMFATEDQALIEGGVRDATWLGWFGEISYTWAVDWTVIARYDGVRTTQSGLDDPPQSEGDVDVVTAAIRHTIDLSSRAAGAIQLEASQAYTQTNGLPAGEGTPAVTTVLLAVDFEF